MFGKETYSGQGIIQSNQQSNVGQLLGSGIANMGQLLAGGIKKRSESRGESKLLRSLMKTVTKSQKEMGMISKEQADQQLDESDAMGLNELRGWKESLIVKEALRVYDDKVKKANAQERRANRADQRAQESHEAGLAQAEANKPLAGLRQQLLNQQLSEGDLQNELLGLQLEQTKQRLGGAGLAIPDGLEIAGATVNPDGQISYSYRAGGKDLSQTELQKLSAIKQAQRDIESLERFYDGHSNNFGGPIAGRTKGFFQRYFGGSPETQRGGNLADSAVSNIARGVFGEVGVLTDADIRRYRDLLPLPTDTHSTRQNKIRDLSKRLKSQLAEQESMLQGAGRNLPESAGDPSGEVMFKRGVGGALTR